MAEVTGPSGAMGGPLFGVTEQFFAEDEWPHASDPAAGMISLAFQGENGQWMCYAQIDEVNEWFVFYSVCPVAVPEARRPAMADFITRANYGLIIGNFELDFEDGELRYKTSLDVEGAGLSPALVRQCVYPNVLTMDQYLPGIMAMIYSEVSPSEALDKVGL